MYLRLDLPTVYRVQPEKWLVGGPNQKQYMSWGWCRAEEVVEAINRHYGLSWNEFELVDRFGLNRELIPTIKLGNKLGLRIMTSNSDDTNFSVGNFSDGFFKHLRESKQKFFVPAGWTKEVLWAIYSGGRKLVIQDGAIGVFGEDNQPIMLW